MDLEKMFVCVFPQIPSSCMGERNQNILSILNCLISYTKNFKKNRTAHLIRFLLRQGEPGTSQYIIVLSRHWYEAWGYEAEAKPKLWSNHEAEAEAEALTFWKHKAEAEAEAFTFSKHEA